ncbi:hypothetical protein HK096_006403 [Nowakowskiella sp. JEL0078]|nr:hypothetical protein HK096_006403 [Nowakowskiella sp. JEL0078]
MRNQLFVFVVLALILQSALAALIGNWNTCNTGDTCNSGYQCCVATADVASGKKTCRSSGCVATSSSSTGVRVGNWLTCNTGDTCNSGYTCCVSSSASDQSSGKKTCRLSGCIAKVVQVVQDLRGRLQRFPGTNSGIGSWFQANSAQSYTNGHSWCGYPYKDYTPGFAPDISVMTDWTNAVYGNPNWSKYATNYCGLEATVYNPKNGVTLTLYITDAFDHAWVKTPGSIDIMKNSFDKLFGKSTWSHNDVIQGVQWKFTGKRSAKYSFGGSGDP